MRAWASSCVQLPAKCRRPSRARRSRCPPWPRPRALVGPRPLEEENRPPSYPRESRLRGEEGSVGLALWIRCDGTVAEARVAKSSGRARLDRAALAAARGWRFAPATRDGVAIESGFEMDIEFRLRARD
jgi:TonB family protein